MDNMNKKGISKYYQLEEYIREKIKSKEWTQDSKIPSEMEIAKYFNVSRSTVRHAISNLVQEGILIRKQGLGTFVTRPSFTGNYLKLYFPKEFGNSHKLIEIRQKKASSYTSRCLEIPIGSTVTEIVRLRFIGKETEASILEKSYYDSNLFYELEKEDLSKRIYEILESKFQISIVKSKTLIEPVLLTNKEASYLKSNPGSPVLLLTRIGYTHNEKPIILTKSLVLAEKCKLLISD